ncbi:MAG: ABC transporter permease subunit [bacterium]|nr:ABC transporter permease subunit [bacterium]
MSDLANVFRRHFRRDRNALFIWGGLCGGFGLLIAVIYPSFAESLEGMLANYPEAFLRAFMGGTVPSFGTVEGFMALEYFSWIPVMYAAYAALAGAGMVAEETDRGTVEFLLAQPVRRSTVIAGKFLVFLVYLAGIVVVSALGLSGGLYAAGVDHSLRLFGHQFVSGYLVAMAYGAISLLISVLAGELRRATSVSLGVVFGTWFLLMAANLSERMELLGYLSPLCYAGATAVLERGSLPPGDVAVLLAITAVAFVAALVLFERKELAA